VKLAHFFIDRPRFAAVVNIFIMVFGLAAAAFLPVAQYPNIVPPTVQITTAYPGASAETIARTVATPLEQAVNGVENMDYISSQSTSNGLITITVIFKIGTDINTALMLTQNRVQDTLSGCPRTSSCRACRSRRPSQPCSLACIPIPRTGPAAPNTSPTI
jgi:multidrug efflux pump subunit AcrB